MRQYNSVHIIERIVSCATYLTAGMVGFVWMIIAALMKKNLTKFVLYHTFQSIFLYIAYFLLFELYMLVFVIIAKIPVFNTMIFVFNNIINSPMPIFSGLSLLQTVTTAVIIYLAVTAFMGQYSYFPWVSDIINANIGRK